MLEVIGYVVVVIIGLGAFLALIGMLNFNITVAVDGKKIFDSEKK